MCFCAGNAWPRLGDFVRLGVIDTGSGMEEKLLDRIFEPFFTTKPVDQGSRLGLATFYGIAEGHGGFVHVTSRLGEGSTFEVYFPIVDGSVGKNIDAGSAPTTVPPPGQIEILIVEDDEPVGNFAARVLSRAGYITRTACDVAEALEILAGDWSPGLIVTDAIMPRMNGFEMYKILRAGGSNVPIIFSSGYSANSFAAEVRSDPRVALVPKPYTKESMLSAIANLLSLHED